MHTNAYYSVVNNSSAHSMYVYARAFSFLIPYAYNFLVKNECGTMLIQNIGQQAIIQFKDLAIVTSPKRNIETTKQSAPKGVSGFHSNSIP